MFNFNTADLESSVNTLSTTTVTIACVLMVIFVLLALWVTKNKKKKLKLPIFIGMVLVIASTTLTISGATIYLNVKSATGGPVHWHADFEVWACGNELELRDPRGVLSNKIGTPTLHEHNDKRIHLEGVPVSLPHDASLGKFMNVIGGEVSKNSLVVPLNDNDYFVAEQDGDGATKPAPELVDPFIKTERDGKVASFINGQTCGAAPAEVQVFAYSFNKEDKTYTQTKVTDPTNYAIAKESEVPPGDCVIFEFDAPKDRTNKLCKQYGVRDKVKCSDFGVTGDGRKICENTEVR